MALSSYNGVRASSKIPEYVPTAFSISSSRSKFIGQLKP